MKKSLITLVAVAFAIGFLSVACEDDGACTSNDASECAEEATDCLMDFDPTSGTSSEDAAECTEDWCDCLDDQGCDEYLDAAGC
jgi:hypothetical protein